MTEALGAIQAELRSHEIRINANHDSVGVLRERTAQHETAIKVIMSELKEAREDVNGISGRLERLDGSITIRFDKLGRNFYVAIVAALGLMLSIVGLIATILAQS